MSKTSKQQKFSDLLASIDDKLEKVGENYVKKGEFGTKLRTWTREGARATTNQKTREQVETYIHTDTNIEGHTMEYQIVLTALLLTSNLTSNQRIHDTEYMWTQFITTDIYFEMYLQDCLNWMTLLVQLGAEPKQAWQHVLECVWCNGIFL